jgi:hypothetical protein
MQVCMEWAANAVVAIFCSKYAWLSFHVCLFFVCLWSIVLVMLWLLLLFAHQADTHEAPMLMSHDNKGHVDFVVRKRESLSSHLLHADFVGLLNAQHNLGYLCHYWSTWMIASPPHVICWWFINRRPKSTPVLIRSALGEPWLAKEKESYVVECSDPWQNFLHCCLWARQIQLTF